MGEQRVTDYRLYEDWYDGRRGPRLTTRQKTYLEASGIPFSENFCETVIDVMAERMKVVGFQVQDNDPASDWLTSTVWPRNRMDETQGVVHTETPKLGDGFVIVSFDDRRMLPSFHWNRPHCIKPVYDDDGELMLYASKVWSTSRPSASNPDGRLIVRMNIYRPDRVEKWYSLSAAGDENGTWLPHHDLEDDEWPTPWTASGEIGDDEADEDDALGIPVFHFRNKPKGRRFGRSELRGAIPFNEQLDKQVLDLFAVMDSQGWPQRWGTGVGEGDSVKVAIGEYLKTAAADARFGQFDAADPRPMIEAIEATLRRLSVKTRTPLHDLIKGDPPSGEALKTAESGLVKKCEDRQTTFGNAWEDAMRLAWRLGDVLGTPGAPAYVPDADVDCVWDSVETRDEQSEALVFSMLHDLGLSKRTILRKLGFDPDEELERRAEEDASAMAALQPSPPERADPQAAPTTA